MSSDGHTSPDRDATAGHAGGPLAGMRVVALEQSVAAPVASRILADAGAYVIKVEPPRGDFARHWDEHVHGRSSHFTWLARRKRSIALELSAEGDLRTFYDLVERSDVLIYNVAVETAEKLGLTPESIAARWPSLVACQVTGYGRTGEASPRRAYDMLVQAETGLMDLTGDEAGPARIGVSISDIGTGLYAVALILAALLERQRTGMGRFVDISMFEAMTEFAGPNLTAFANAGVSYGRFRSRHHSIVPYGLFRCKDGQIAIAVQQDSEWQRLAACIGRPDLAARADLATNVQRVNARAEVEREVEAALEKGTRSEWGDRLAAAQIAYGLLQDIGGVWEHDVSRDLGLHGSAVLDDETVVAVPRSPMERTFGLAAPALIPGLDGNRHEILADLNLRTADESDHQSEGVSH